jgi:cytochrome c peroxidase
MNWLFFTFLFFSSQLFANTELDLKLQSYIKKFNLKNVESPGHLNKRLFALGGKLFFEREISGNKNISCADCHHPRTHTIDNLPLALGEGASGIETFPGNRQQYSGKIIPRNSPALFNLHNVSVLFWDGRVQWDQESGKVLSPIKISEPQLSVLKNALAIQALFPMLSHEEMRGQIGTNDVSSTYVDEEAWEIIFNRIMSKDYYRIEFEQLFPGEELSIAHVGRAIAHFEEQAFYSSDTPYDRYIKGDVSALSEVEKKGMDVFFGKGECWKCHKGEHLSDFSFHNIGVPQIGPGKKEGDDRGVYEINKKREGLYAFRVPPLRNVALTAPYMHDGALKTLEEVVEHYDDIASSLLGFEFINDYKNYVEKIDGPMKETDQDKLDALSFKLSKKLFFTEEEEEALVEFLKKSLTDVRFINERP